MSGAFEVGYVCLDILFGSTPFPLGSDFGFDCDQELKEWSRCKLLFTLHESGVWAALSRQRALVEDANKRWSEKSAKADKLRVIHAALKEEAAQAQDTAAKAHEDATKAREEATKAREDLAPLLARVKALEEDIALVSGQRDALNVQVRLVSARVGTLTEEVEKLKETIRERDEALSSTGREIEMLRATVHDKDEALWAAKKAHGELRSQIVGWQTHVEGKFLPNSDLDFGLLCFC
jgi:chromosome segregation ATPase